MHVENEAWGWAKDFPTEEHVVSTVKRLVTRAGVTKARLEVGCLMPSLVYSGIVLATL